MSGFSLRSPLTSVINQCSDTEGKSFLPVIRLTTANKSRTKYKTYNFLIDTGAEVSIVDVDAFSSILGIVDTSDKFEFSVLGAERTYNGTLTSINIKFPDGKFRLVKVHAI